MSDHLIFPKANPVRIVRTEFAGLNYRDPDNLLFHEWSQPHARTYCQPFEQKDILQIQFESSFDNNFIRLVRCPGGLVQIDDSDGDEVLFEDSVAAESEDSGAFLFEGVAGSATETIKVESGYSVLEGYYPLAIPEGKYKLIGYGNMDSGAETYKIESEIIEVRKRWKNSVKFQYYSNEPGFGIDYRSGVTMQFRVLADFMKDADETEFENIVAASSMITKLTDVTLERRLFELWELTPSWMIKKINLILGHDYVTIDDVEVTGGERLAAEFNAFGHAWGQPSTVINLKNSNLKNRHDTGSRTLY